MKWFDTLVQGLTHLPDNLSDLGEHINEIENARPNCDNLTTPESQRHFMDIAGIADHDIPNR